MAIKYKKEEFIERTEIKELKDCVWDMNCLTEGSMQMITYWRGMSVILEFQIVDEDDNLVNVDFVNKMSTDWVCENIVRPGNLEYRSIPEDKLLDNISYWSEYYG